MDLFRFASQYKVVVRSREPCRLLELGLAVLVVSSASCIDSQVVWDGNRLATAIYTTWK